MGREEFEFSFHCSKILKSSVNVFIQSKNDIQRQSCPQTAAFKSEPRYCLLAVLTKEAGCI